MYIEQMKNLGFTTIRKVNHQYNILGMFVRQDMLAEDFYDGYEIEFIAFLSFHPSIIIYS